MGADPDATGGPDPEWFRAELDAAQAEMASLRHRLDRAETSAEAWRHVAVDNADPPEPVLVPDTADYDTW